MLALEPLLDVDAIQGNVVAPFAKDHQAFVFLVFDDRAAARTWTRAMADHVASTAEVLAFNRIFRALRARRGHDPDGLRVTWRHLAFSATGLRKLTSDAEVDAFVDDGFKVGLAERSAVLGDPLDPASEGHPSRWLVGGTTALAPDAVVIVASDDAAMLAADVALVIAGLPPGVRVLFRQDGATLPGDRRGHEHFGFRDGISQPGVRGRVSAADDDFITPRLLADDDPMANRFAKPGQPLVWPGQFVFGYPTQDPRDPEAPGPIPARGPAWADNGSYLVLRRLRQDVAGFWRFMDETAHTLATRPGFAGLEPVRLASMLIGRWPSGAPIARTARTDDPAMARSDVANNAFGFKGDSPHVRLRGTLVDPFPPAAADPNGRRCPFAAHIRKVNPRDLDTEQGGSNDTLTRLVLRRGIPFGAPMGPSEGDAAADRGLVFVSFQSSIELQFEFLVQTWADRTDKPETNAGHDPVIGQSTDAAGSRQRTVPIPGDDGSTETLTLPADFILPTGGEYFFSPSIPALRTTLGS
jgi:Dyp-type peroxidase family